MIDWKKIDAKVMAQLVQSLKDAGMSLYNIKLFVPSSALQGVVLVNAMLRNPRGRPPEKRHETSKIDISKLLDIVDYLYQGYDLFSIARYTQLDINHVVGFIESDCEMGYNTCECGKAYIYIDEAPLFCPKCSPLSKKIAHRTRIVQYSSAIQVNRTLENYRKYNLELIERLTQRMIEEAHAIVVSRQIAEMTEKFVQSIGSSRLLLSHDSVMLQYLRQTLQNMKKVDEIISGGYNGQNITDTRAVSLKNKNNRIVVHA